jgi:uncharacterized membrane protein HdeD (DUF308 family)
MHDVPAVLAMMIPIVGAVALFTFLAIASRAEARRKTEEARAKYEFLKKLAEGPGFDLDRYARFQEIEAEAQTRRRVDNLLLAGWILVAAGVSLMMFLFTVGGGAPIAVGIIPAGVGAALLVSAFHRRRGLPERQRRPLQPQ